jgi:malonate-semialdehyde dehydrogenase (acetylating)/methylmalonate-semialdehyde dehydrogenase
MSVLETSGTSIVSHWINGKGEPATSGRHGVVNNPATGEVIAKVGFAGVEDVDRAVVTAKAAAADWRGTPLSRRAEVLFHLRDLIVGNRAELARIISLENGKTIADALGEVARGLENVEFACGIPNLLKGGYTEQASRGVDVYQIRQPIGVVAGITPFNFPAMVPLWMLSTAIACGNAFILKPSEKVPGASVLLAQLAKKAGVPDGILNLVHGDKVAIYETATRNGKRVQALGGAKNHMLVLPDADIAMAADAAVSAAYGAAGERCMAISVVLAVGSAADQLIGTIRERVEKIKVGPGSEPASEMGPLITREHRDRVAGHLDTAVAEGATLAIDGRLDPAMKSSGFFLGPSLIDNARPGMRCYDNEIFGPVLSVVRISSYAEGLRIINENPYGNGAAIFTQNGGAARQFQFDVEAGMVGINVPIPVPVSYYSFGGWKSSLFGDLHMYGPEGVQFYTRSKVVTSRWPDPGASKVDLGFPQVR